MRRRWMATSSGCGGSRRRRRSSSAGSKVPYSRHPSPLSPALKPSPFPVASSGADARRAGWRRVRALGRRRGCRRPLPVHRDPPVPELLLRRRLCVSVPMVCLPRRSSRSLLPPHRHICGAISPKCLTSLAVRSFSIAVRAATTPPSARTSSPCSTRTARPPASVCIRAAKRAQTYQSAGFTDQASYFGICC